MAIAKSRYAAGLKRLVPLALMLSSGVPALVGCCAHPAPVAPGVTLHPDPASYAMVEGKKVDVPSIPMGNARTIRRIIEQGTRDNHVMDHLTHLTTAIGPRLTGSARNHESRLWAADLFRSWGLANVRLEKWGEIPVGFDRGPSSGKIFLHTQRRKDDGTSGPEEDIKLRDMDLTTLSWSAGTHGPIKGPAIKMPRDDAEYAAAKPRLKGAWILLERPSREGMRGLRWQLGDDARRIADARKRVADGSKKVEELPILERLAFDGVAGFITASRDERVWTGALPWWRELDPADIPQDVHVQVRLSDYDCINSRLADGEDVSVEIDAQNAFTKGPIPCHLVIAEIPGATHPEEVVIMSAHMDSWDGPGSQGCTDNGTGSSVMIEAARLLATAGARPDRTIRFILWDGEEQGLLGSTAYVEELKKSGLLDRISCCFVDDGGTNFQGGVACLASQVEYLAAATAPVNGLFYDTASKEPMNVNIHAIEALGAGGGSDHASFNRVGVPGFYWDEVGRADYGHGWHTQYDRIDLAIPEYLMQSATCSAVTAYNLACAPTLLPRAPQPAPTP